MILKYIQKEVNRGWHFANWLVRGISTALFVAVVIPSSPFLLLLTALGLIGGGGGPGTISNAANFAMALLLVAGSAAAGVCLLCPPLYFALCLGAGLMAML
jgi:hypothetical protein